MSESVPLGVVEAIADTKDIDPAELDHALENHIETDALELLAAHDNSSWALAFELPDCRVTVTGDGRVLVDGERACRWKPRENGGSDDGDSLVRHSQPC